MKPCKSNKIFRLNGKTIAILSDPDGSMARTISNEIFHNEKLENAKEDLKKHPLPDYILKRYEVNKQH